MSLWISTQGGFQGHAYWVGQKVHSGFSIRCYGKTPTNFLANPIYGCLDKSKTLLWVYLTEKRGAVITRPNKIKGWDLLRALWLQTEWKRRTDLIYASAFVCRGRSGGQDTPCGEKQRRWPADHTGAGSRRKRKWSVFKDRDHLMYHFY